MTDQERLDAAALAAGTTVADLQDAVRARMYGIARHRVQQDYALPLFPLDEPTDPCRMLPASLQEEKGMGGFVCIWRMPRDGSDIARHCSVGEFLSRPENFGGAWYIDGGWGGPPGPIRVYWDDVAKAWRNHGYPPWDRADAPHQTKGE